MTGAMLSLDGVSKRFGDRKLGGRSAVDDATLAVAAGERLALVGPSGCGKSTLLKMVLGIVTPDRGRITVDGEALTEANVQDVRRRIGTVLQDGGLFPHLDARANVTLVARLLGWAPAKLDARVAELADLVRLPRGHLSRAPRELSGGERQRVGLMRALMLDPGVLLLDEPLGALDPVVRARLQEDLREVFTALRKCVVIVTHDMAEAAYLADSIAVMREGRILQRGSLRTLLETPAHAFVTELLSAQKTLRLEA